VEEAALGNYSAQSPASVRMASPEHAMEHCKFKCSICSWVQQVWWSLHWGLRPGCSGGLLWGLCVCRFVKISRGGGSTWQPQRTEPCQCVSGQLWPCHGALQGQMQPLQCAEGVGGPALGAAAVLGRWFVAVVVFASLWRFPEDKAALGNHSAQSPASV